jgi:copper chaperone NosL
VKIYAVLLMAILILTVAVGCGGGANTEEPPPIVYGQDLCDRCGMIINEEKFAAAYWTEAGEALRFDDIGGMVAHLDEKPEEVATLWVHDYHTAEWIRAEEATYLLDRTLMTPMGFGLVAFAIGEQAQDMAAGSEEAQVLSFEELLEMEMSMPSAHSHHMEEADHG